jgi:hypothetical protein
MSSSVGMTTITWRKAVQNVQAVQSPFGVRSNRFKVSDSVQVVLNVLSPAALYFARLRLGGNISKRFELLERLEPTEM